MIAEKFTINYNWEHNLRSYFLIYGFIWIIGYFLIYKLSQSEIRKQIDKVWIQTVSANCKIRLAEVGLEYIRGNGKKIPPTILIETKNRKTIFSKDEVIAFADTEEKKLNALQTLLLEENPIQVNKLDNLFQKRLEEVNISTSTAVAYINVKNNQKQHSSVDTTFYKHAFATTEIKTGVDGSIILLGYADLSWEDCVKHAKIVFMLWFLCGIFVEGMIFYLKFIKPNKRQTLIYYVYNRILINGDKSIQLPPLEGSLLHLLLTCKNSQKGYDELLHNLWKEKDGNKKRLERVRYALDEKLKDMPGIQIRTISRHGYQLHIKKGYTIRIEE